MSDFTRIEPKKELRKTMRVAAYARVSVDKDAMLHSLGEQVDHYRALILANPEWEFAGVYADYATTGTKGDRAEFERLLGDARAGRIDLILTKSVARFARNLLLTVGVARELKALGVDVFFEEQGVHSLSGDGELMLSLAAAFAQQESRNSSERMKWRVKREFEKGRAWPQAITGYRWEDGSFAVVPEEAETVRAIYALYLSGEGLPSIAREMERRGIGPKRGGKRWSIGSVRRILTCYTYTGNLLLQTTFKSDHIEKARRKNRGEYRMFHVEGDHEAIIPLEDWKAVQEEMKRRDAAIDHKTGKPASLFSGKLICCHCGKHYVRKVSPYGAYYICPTYSQRGKAECPSAQVREEPLMAATESVLGTVNPDRAAIEGAIDHVEVRDGNLLVFHLKDGRAVERAWSYRSRRESWTEEMKEKARIDGRKKGGKRNG